MYRKQFHEVIFHKICLTLFLSISSAAIASPSVQDHIRPCTAPIEERTSILFHKPGYPAFSDNVWNKSITLLRDCTSSANICIVTYNFDTSETATIKAKSVNDESLTTSITGTKQQVLFAAVQIHDKTTAACFLARNGFVHAQPWLSEGWVIRENDSKQLAHFDLEKMGQVGDIHYAASPREIASALKKGYYQLYKQ